MIEIARWSETFENADTRKRERLKSFHAPSGIESRGLLNLLCYFENKEALAAFGLFQLICQLSATLRQKHRGRLLHSDGKPMSEEFLARLLRVEICHFRAGIEILADERVGWVIRHESADNLPVVCHRPPGFVQGEGEVEGEVEEREAPPPADSSESPKPNQFQAKLPKAQAADFQRITERINACNPRWRPQLSRLEMEAIFANSWMLAEITDSDWTLLRAYMHAFIDDTLGKFYQPDGRERFIETISDVLTHAEKWRATCEREGVPTGLETNRKAIA